MVNKKLLVCISLLILLFNCKSPNEELAVFEGGKVLRKDLREFFANRNETVDENSASVKSQTSIVEQLALLSIVEIEAGKKKLLDSEMYKKTMELTDIQIISSLYMKNRMEKIKSDTKAEMITVQFLLLDPASTNKQDVLDKVNGMKSESEVFDYISDTTTEEQRRPVGGFFEPQCRNCSGEIYLENVFKEGLDSPGMKFYSTEFDGKLFIYRIVENKKVAVDDLESFFKKKFSKMRDYAIEFQNKNQGDKEKQLASYYAQEDPQFSQKVKMFAQRTSSNFEKFYQKKEIESLQSERGIKVSTDFIGYVNTKVPVIPENTIVVESKEKPYLYSDLNKEFAELSKIQKSIDLKNDTEKLNYVQRFVFPKMLVVDSPEAEKIKNSDKYASNLSFVKKNIASNMYIQDIQENAISVTDKEIKDTYEAGKAFEYSEEVDKVKRPIPFEKVKDRIKDQIIQSKLKSEIDKRIQDLKTSYKLQFFIDRLKAGEI